MPKIMDRYIEMVENHVSNRGNIIDRSKYKSMFRDYESYVSLYTYSDSIIKYIEETGSIVNYIGDISMSSFWIDIDAITATTPFGNISNTLPTVKYIIERLNSIYHLPYESILIYFSGNKGFHIGIKDSVLGSEGYSSEYLPQICKLLVDRICYETRDLVDKKIYNTTRIFRTPLSRHPKTGYYKVPIDYKYILKSNVNKVLELAQRKSISLSYSYDFSLCPSLLATFKEIVNTASKSPTIETVANKQQASSLFHIPKSGSRNDTLFKQAYRLFTTDLNTNEVVDIMNYMADLTNSASQNKLSNHEINSLVNSAFQRTRSKPMGRFIVHTLSSLVTPSYDTIRNSRTISTLVPEFDADLDGGLVVGNLYSFIGLGGTLKSVEAQEILIENALVDKNFYGLYFNMEMSNVQLYNRAQMKLLNQEFKNAVRLGQTTKEDIQRIEFKMKEIIERRLLIISQNDLSPEDVEVAIDQCETLVKNKITACVGDSMNGMKLYNDHEGTSAFKLTKGIKEVAKKKDVCFILINHVKTGVSKFLRDVSGHVRGGQKVIDNGDAYFCFSLVVDSDRSDIQNNDLVAIPGLVCIRFVNKRESGNTIDKILKLNLENSGFKMEPLPVDPNMFTVDCLKRN